ncbi:MAG: aminotransferase DegT [bacterium]|nr:aminotransferase DegT [bacterium]
MSEIIAHSAPTLGPDEEAAALRVIQSGHLAQGAEVAAFEAECAEAFGRRHVVAVNSGTAALHLALSAVGVPQDAPVAIPSYVCAALATAIGLHGGRPVLCDNRDDGNLDPDAVPAESACVVVPHLFGAPAPLPDHPLVIEDTAQSMGNDTGRASIAAITSFYATKLITTGEGGMLLTDDEGVAGHARDRRDYDNRDSYIQRYNYKMTDLAAAIGRVQVRRLPEFVQRRRAIAAVYSEAFRDLPLALPEREGHVFFRYVVASDRRDALADHLAGCAVDAKRPVYRPMHHHLGGEFPGADKAHRTFLSLPIYPNLTDPQVAHVVESVRRFFDQ